MLNDVPSPAPYGSFGQHALAADITIGVFDSGSGGLTVLAELERQLPSASYIYLGDTARLPYGSKSRDTVARYAVSSATFLVEQGAQLLVIACNTATALALDAIQAAVPVPVIGVISPGADAASAASKTGDIFIMATAATVASHAYLGAACPRGMRGLEKACPLLVPLVEEGWIDHPVTRQVIRIYLDEMKAEALRLRLEPDTLVLGCTHYPLIRRAIEQEAGEGITVVDSAEVVARTVRELCQLPPAGYPHQPTRFYATDGAERFRELGSRFLGRTIDHVQMVDLGG